MSLCFVGASVALLVTILLVANRSSNCGGNSAALAACDGYCLALREFAESHPGESLEDHLWNPEWQTRLDELPGESWLGGAHLLVRLDANIDRSQPREIVIVCPRSFSNVPRGYLLLSPASHAVGYSDGEVGLISPAEFTKLDLTRFTSRNSISRSPRERNVGAGFR